MKLSIFITNIIIDLFHKYQENKNKKKTIKEIYRLKHYLKNKDSLKIHFGCGPRILKDWINIDLNYMDHKYYFKNCKDKYYPPEIKGNKDDFFAINITKTKFPLKDNSVDLIFHEDFIEHLNQKEQVIFLAETYRILKKDLYIESIRQI
ncbi:class I SAM-dependent methyltransferase [Candidatus Beckwithbacteria bacterium]|nr:class I SAM-dependent methyltransferase [Candidatus Beckwithbacteria bacterium]